MKEVDGWLIQISTDYVFGKEPYNIPCGPDQKVLLQVYMVRLSYIASKKSLQQVAYILSSVQLGYILSLGRTSAKQ